MTVSFRLARVFALVAWLLVVGLAVVGGVYGLIFKRLIVVVV